MPRIKTRMGNLLGISMNSRMQVHLTARPSKNALMGLSGDYEVGGKSTLRDRLIFNSRKSGARSKIIGTA